MKLKIRKLAIALALALLAGLSVSSATQAKTKPMVIVTQQFRSQAKYDGNVIEYADDYWVGGKFNSSAPYITIGDDYTKKNWVGILDFDTALLPDTAIVSAAYLELSVLKYTTVYGDPYLLLGDINVEFNSPYYGASRMLESQDFEWFGAFFAGILPQATNSNQRLTFEVDSSVVWQISLTEPTQFKLYFWDDNDDRYSQGISIASGNHSVVRLRPLLTVYFYYP